MRCYCVFVPAVRRGDVLAAWSGIRPLVTDPNSKDTQSICRNHIVSISDSGLVTIAGRRILRMIFLKYCAKAVCLPCSGAHVVFVQVESGRPTGPWLKKLWTQPSKPTACQPNPVKLLV